MDTNTIKQNKLRLVSNLMYKIKDHLRKLPQNIRVIEVTEDWLYNKLESNNWCCPYTKVEFPLLTKNRISRSEYKSMGINKLKMASVDRLDSSKGYTFENTQIVCRFYNLGKTDNSNEDAIEILEYFKNQI